MEQSIDAYVVLGCRDLGESVIRCQKAMEHYQRCNQNGSLEIILTGTEREIDRMAVEVRKPEHSYSNMLHRCESTNTIGNAISIKEHINKVEKELKDVHIFTSSYHAPRVKMVFERVFRKSVEIVSVPINPGIMAVNMELVYSMLSKMVLFYQGYPQNGKPE